VSRYKSAPYYLLLDEPEPHWAGSNRIEKIVRVPIALEAMIAADADRLSSSRHEVARWIAIVSPILDEPGPFRPMFNPPVGGEFLFMKIAWHPHEWRRIVHESERRRTTIGHLVRLTLWEHYESGREVVKPKHVLKPYRPD
jgi:hypothetical protein